jgi:protein-tyrosine-phosphatase
MKQNSTIVFVCEHGAAKSVLAATHFNRLAGELNLEVRAIARGTNPDPQISEQTIRGLSKDGLAPTESVPQKLSLEDARSARNLVSFCELPADYAEVGFSEQWNGIPPVSENYDQARDAILERLDLLISRIRRSS